MLLLTSLFISDLDGTLLNDKQVEWLESIRILNKADQPRITIYDSDCPFLNWQPETA